jgi:hypothetical protein
MGLIKAKGNMYNFSSVGADSKNCHLPEPSSEKVRDLITELSKFTKVIQKDNLKRLLI